MKVTVAVNDRFARTPDGRVWTNGSNGYRIFSRYLSAFEEVSVLARVGTRDEVSGEWQRADGRAVRFVDLPWFVGPLQYARRYGAVRAAIRQAGEAEGAAIVRLPAWHVTGTLADVCRRRGRPYAVEVLNDPLQALTARSPWDVGRRLLRRWIDRRTRTVCQGACGALYVTQRALQSRYPPGQGAPTVGCSDVSLSPDDYRTSPRTFNERTSFTLVFVGSLQRAHKGVDVLIRALAMAARSRSLRLEVLGEGKLGDSLAALARRAGVSSQVDFRGQLGSGGPVRERLDQADLFVLPSYGEGLPRALLEAMARGLPCVATTAGGVPELLPAQDLVEPGDVGGLAAALLEITSDAERMGRMSVRNLQVAREYSEDVLGERRARFYADVRARSTPSGSGTAG